MDVSYRFRRLDLYDNKSLHQQVYSIAQLNHYPVVHEWKCELPLVLDSRPAELVSQAGLICTFKQSWAKDPVDLQRAAEHTLADRILLCDLRASSAISALNLPGFAGASAGAGSPG